MQAWQPVDKMCVSAGKTGGNAVIDAPNTGKSASAPGHSIHDIFSRYLDFFLIVEVAGYDYILCLLVCAANWLFRLQIGAQAVLGLADVKTDFHLLMKNTHNLNSRVYFIEVDRMLLK